VLTPVDFDDNYVSSSDEEYHMDVDKAGKDVESLSQQVDEEDDMDMDQAGEDVEPFDKTIDDEIWKGINAGFRGGR
jgi:hypothetical protein